MTEDVATLGQKLKQQLLHCEGFDGDAVSASRVQALNYYFQRPRGDEVDGRAAVVSGDLSAMVEATLAQMMDSLSSDRVCDFDPFDADDEDQAQLESEAVQWFVMGQENGFLELTAAIKEALLLRNGIIKIEAMDKTERRTRRLGNVEPDALLELLAPDEVVAHQYDEEKQELLLTIETTKRDFVMESVALENFLYYADWHKHTLDGIPVCAVRHVDTRAELIAMDFPRNLVEGLPRHSQDLKAETQAKNPKHFKKPTQSIGTLQEPVEWYEVYVRMTMARGVDELHRVCMSYVTGDIFKKEPVPFLRLASGTAILNPHRFTGISLFDKLKQNQDIRTALRRALLDNVNATTKNRLAGLEGIVNEDDISDGRVNNLVRVAPQVPDIRGAIMALQVPDTSANILANLESSAKERAEMGGAALDLQTAQMQIGGDRMGSQGLDRAYSVAEQLSAAMMKTIAATLIRSVFLLAHQTLREYFDEELPIKRNGKWTYVKPSEWPERTNVTVKPGMSPGERSRRAGVLGQILDAQMMLSDKGMDGVLVGIDQFNRCLMDWARMSEAQNPEQYFIDPQSDAAQAALQSKQQQAQELDRQKKTLMQNAFGLEQMRTAFEKYRHDSELQFKYYAELLGVQVEEAKIAGAATVDITKAKRDAETQQRQAANGSAKPGEQSTAADDTGGAA